MQTFLSWPMHTPANHLDELGVLPEKDLEFQLSDLLGRGQRAVRRGFCGSVGATPNPSAIFLATGTQIGCGRQGLMKFLDQCEIQVDRADGKGWVVLTFDTTPDYLDTTPLPAALTKWKYRAIYRVDDHQVGQWSAEASVSVGG